MTFAPPRPSETIPTGDEIAAARLWALDHDHQALLAHRFALLTRASWEAQTAADRHLVARHRASLA
ncbi:hypothetical protein [Xylanimonas protaetiae]|uniref:Uncharacterized protein n=1 Tax=Xylanimonas protaetiae TaxID=2509457 RepID=A0A4V0YFY9_9MICO|nr:hypothetical protein [Xylanimonas protaetiae]QAY69371.1 hypothetical protein ET471_04370 [Xylanimonas protaetiae]